MSREHRPAHPSDRRPRLCLGLLAALLLWPDRSQADGKPGLVEDHDLSLASLLDVPDEVWAATKTEQKHEEAPAIITTITRDQLTVWGYRSLAEVLSHLLGFYIVDDHTSPNLAIRGVSGGLHADSSIVKVLIDGHSVAFHSTGGNWLGPELVPLSAVERIEIVRGPASALFGADAFLGVVNIRTRTGVSLGGMEAWLTAGRVGREPASDVDVSVGFKTGGLDVLLAARRTSQDLSGLKLPDSSPAPGLSDPDRSREASGLVQESTSALARVTWQAGSGAEIGLLVYHSSMLRGAEFGSLLPLTNGSRDGILSENRVSQSQQRAGLFFQHTLASQLRLSLQGAVFRGQPRADNRLEVGSDFYYVRRQFGFRGADLDTQVEWTPRFIDPGRIRLVAGGNGFVDDELLASRLGIAKQATQELQPGDVIDNISVYQGRKVFANGAAYLQGIWSAVPDWLSVTGGLRYDRHNVYGGRFSERLGLVSNPSPTVHAKLLYGSAFKAPSPTLLHALPAASGDVVGNPALEPQYVRTVELQLAWEAPHFFSVSSGVAYGVLSDKTEFVQQGISQMARNLARAATLSWETMAEVKYQGMVRAHLGFEMQRTVRQTGQEGYAAQVIGTAGGIYPNTMVHAGVVAQPRALPLRVAVQASYIGSRRASDTNILLNDGAYRLPAYLLLEAGLSTPPFDLFGRQRNEVAFSLNGKNLLAAAGATPGFSGVDYPLAPRAFLLQANVGF